MDITVLLTSTYFVAPLIKLSIITGVFREGVEE